MKRSDEPRFRVEPAWTKRLLSRLIPPMLAAGLVFLAWWQLVRYFQVPAYLVPSPQSVAETCWNDRSRLLSSFLQTGFAASIGLLLSTVVGLCIGILFAQSSILRLALYPYAIFLQTVPIVAIAPLLVLWLGYGIQGVIAVAMVLSIFPIIANVTAGMTSIPSPLRELFQLYRASRWQHLWKLQLPYAVPNLVTGIKTSSGLAVIGAIVGEFFVGYGNQSVGLGYLIRSSSDILQTATLFAAVLLSTLLGVTLFATVSLLSEFVLRRWNRP